MTAARRERSAQLFGGPLGIGGIRPETQIELDVRGMHVDRTEGARVDEDERAAVVEVEHGAREARQLDARLGQHPIAVHAEVRVHDSTVVQMQQLMLATSLDASDARTDERSQLCRLEPAAERRMEHAHAHDGASARAGAQHL